MTQDKAQAAGAVSIDSPEFHRLLGMLNRAAGIDRITQIACEIIAFADAHAAQRYEAGHQAGLAHAVQTIKNSNDTASIALEQRDAAESGFKNFHRSLCARFGYSHDERDWKRDQVSLEEYIAFEIAIERKRADTAEASLARLVEALTDIAQPANAGCGCHLPCRCDTPEAERINAQEMREIAESALAILPERAEAPQSVIKDYSIPVVYSDDDAVDLFAAAMKSKMAASRAKGRSGWNDPTLCTADTLRAMMVSHIAKGDPVDVGNFCMMLWNRNESTATPAPAMGEELPKLPRAALVIGSDLNSLNLRFTADQMHAYGRACMALRQPGAVKHAADQADQSGFEVWARTHGGLPLDPAGYAMLTDDNSMALPTYKSSRTEIAWRAWANRPATPAAPVSQPAAQEPMAAYGLRVAERVRACFIRGLEVRGYLTAGRPLHEHGAVVRDMMDLFDLPAVVAQVAAPAPLSAPAGSEQEKKGGA